MGGPSWLLVRIFLKLWNTTVLAIRTIQMTDVATQLNPLIEAPSGDRLRIAIAQTQVEFEPRVDGAENRTQMRRAAEAGARLIQFTEGAISGYPSGEGKQMLAGWNVGWSVLRNELETTAELAADLRLWTVVGSNHPLRPSLSSSRFSFN
jgi:hypothetical protein